MKKCWNPKNWVTTLEIFISNQPKKELLQNSKYGGQESGMKIMTNFWKNRAFKAAKKKFCFKFPSKFHAEPIQYAKLSRRIWMHCIFWLLQVILWCWNFAYLYYLPSSTPQIFFSFIWEFFRFFPCCSMGIYPFHWQTCLPMKWIFANGATSEKLKKFSNEAEK